jgi:pimeloyl-ACP methyl ester carboxylesterase
VSWCRSLIAQNRLPALPYKDLVRWIGATAQFLPKVLLFILSRQQDPTPLFESGKDGLPLLLIYGAEDYHISGDKARDKVVPYFKVSNVIKMEGVGHMPFYEYVACQIRLHHAHFH